MSAGNQPVAAANHSHEERDLPKAKLVHRKRISWIWLVPVIAATVTGWMIYRSVTSGTHITILFMDGSGLEAGQTPIRYRGVKVGEVSAVELTADAQHVEVHARLDKSAETLARGGTEYWVVRPEVSAGGFHGLETIVSGSYIQAQPGDGGPQKKFVGLEQSPPIHSTQGGLEIVLMAPHSGSIAARSPVYYRGIEVGSVQYVELNEQGTFVNVHVQIQQRYVSLIRTTTRFWNAGGVNVDLKLFGINLSAESFKSLVAGGVAFANPEPNAPPAQAGSSFRLYDKPKDEWLE